MLKRRLASLALVLALLLSAAPAAWAGDRLVYATRGQIVSMLLNAADFYNPGLEKGDIIQGYADGQLAEDRPVTRAEAFVMLSRAFGALEQPVGHNARVSVLDLSFDDVPHWAVSHVENLARGGVLAGTGGGSLSPNAGVTVWQMEEMIRRVYSLKGSNLKDDFYATINRDRLAALTIAPGEVSAGAVSDLPQKTVGDLTAIVVDILQKSRPSDKERKIYDFYQTARDMQSRNAAGITPIKPYLDQIEAAGSISDLLALRAQVLSETGVQMLLGFSPMVDPTDSRRYAMTFATMTPALPQALYAAESPVQAAYAAFLVESFVLTGLPRAQAEQEAALFLSFEKALAQSMLQAQEYGDIDKIYNLLDVSEIGTWFPGLDLPALLRADGFKPESRVILFDVALVKTFARFMTDQNLSTLKAAARFTLIVSFGGALSQEFSDLSDALSAVLYGTVGGKTPEETAMLATQSAMGDYLSELYVKTYFSAQAKADVESMARELIALYKQRIAQLDWMSEPTKRMALKKLDAMGVKVGYPDRFTSLLDYVTIKGAPDGGSYYGNLCAISRAARTASTMAQGGEVGRDGWITTPSTVNAFYNAQMNDITLPAAILQAPFYDVNASREENLGGIGFIIAHEITHSFDNSGSKFDQDGNAVNWWSEQDLANFERLCAEVVLYYDGVEAAPGIATNGALTLSENIADLGALSCIVAAAGTLKNPDYDKLFQRFAACWASSSSRPYMQLLAVMDVHSADKLRVNRTLQTVEEFYETYGIEEGDGMYIAPHERVRIW